MQPIQKHQLRANRQPVNNFLSQQPTRTEIDRFIEFVKKSMPADNNDEQKNYLNKTRGTKLTPFPGLADADVVPFLSRRLVGKNGMVFGVTRKELQPPPQAFIEVPMNDGTVKRIPKGFYSAKDVQTESVFDTRLPDVDDALDFIMNGITGIAQRKEKTSKTDGLYLPMPFGLDPVNVQFLSEDVKTTGAKAGVGLTQNDQHIEAPPTLRPDTEIGLRLMDNLATFMNNNNQASVRANDLYTYCETASLDDCQRMLSRVRQIENSHSIGDRFISGDVGDRLIYQFSSRVLPELKEYISEKQLSQESKTSENPFLNFISGFASGQDLSKQEQSKGTYVGLPFLPDFYVGGSK